MSWDRSATREQERERTVLDADHLVHESLVGELRAEGCDKVDVTVNDDHGVDEAGHERRRRQRGERELLPQSTQNAAQSLCGLSDDVTRGRQRTFAESPLPITRGISPKARWSVINALPMS